MYQKIKILVVDDEESLCELMAEILAEEYEVYKAFNGKEALAIAQKYQPHLIISDIMMPQMTGVELLQALRSTEDTRHIPVILLSAALSPSNELQKDVAAFVPKPFEIEQLEMLVSQTMQRVSGEISQREPVVHPPQLTEAAPDRTFRFAISPARPQASYPRYGEIGANYKN